MDSKPAILAFGIKSRLVPGCTGINGNESADVV